MISFTASYLFWLFWSVDVLSQPINCHNYVECDNCVNQTECGWCFSLGVCVAGDKNGPYSGSCDWIYDKCPTTTTLSPSHEISWYAFGSNQQHTGYVPYTTPITEYTSIDIIFNKSWDTLSISPISASKGNIYYWSAESETGASAIYCENLQTDEILWRTDLSSNISYCSQPSLTQNISHLVLFCYNILKSSSNPTIYDEIVILDAKNGTLIPNTFQIKTSNIYTYIAKYSPVIADNLNMFMINYNNRSLGVYTIDPFSKVWNQQIGTYMGSTASSYNPSISCFYTQNQLTVSTYSRYNQLTISQWMNGPLISYNTSEYLSSTWKQNGVVVMSLKHNITFIVGASLCALQWNDSTYPPNVTELWCKSLGSSSGYPIPAIDEMEGIVYFWWPPPYNGYIQALDMFTGTVMNQYDSGNGIASYCNWRYGGYYTKINACLGSQPLIVENNIFWTNGVDIIIFDKKSKYVVNRINAPCNNTAANRGMFLSWSNDNLIVNCLDHIIAYSFQ